MTLALTIVTFIAYIGLGVPDSLLGCAWPAIYPEMGLPVHNVSILSFLISIGTVTSSFMSERVVKKFGTGVTASVSTLLTAVALIGYSLSKNMLWLCLCAIPQGIGAGSVDAALNNYVALHCKASQMNFLHCFYGVGVAISPYLMSFFLRDPSNWRSGYRAMYIIQLVITAVMFASLPMWNKAEKKDRALSADKKPVGFLRLLKMPAVRSQWGVFIGSCSIESMCLVWGSTYLVTAKGVPAAMGSRLITFYFLGLAMGRFVSGLLVNKFSEKTLVYAGQAVTFIAVSVLYFSDNPVMATVGLSFIGFGNGSFFPNMTQLTPVNFGRELSPGVIGTQMAFAYMGIMLSPMIFGLVSDRYSIETFPLFVMMLFAFMMSSMFLLTERLKGAKK